MQESPLRPCAQPETTVSARRALVPVLASCFGLYAFAQVPGERANTASVDRAVTLRLLSPHLFGLALRRSPARGVRWPSGWAENRTADRLRFVAVLAARREGLAVEARETVVSEILSLTPCQLVHSRTPAWRVHKSTASPPRSLARSFRT